MPKYTRMIGQSGGSAADSAIHIGMLGMERRNSIRRWMTLSTVPP